MKALAARRAPLPLKADAPPSRRSSSEEIPLNCEPLEKSVDRCSQAVSAASDAHHAILLEQQALEQQLSRAGKADEAQVRASLRGLEARLTESLLIKKQMKSELKAAIVALEKERMRMYVHIQAKRNIEQARNVASAYAQTQLEAEHDLKEQHELHKATMRQARADRIAAAREKARQEAANAWDPEAREAGWVRIWSLKSEVFPPVERVKPTKWKPPPPPPTVDDPITTFKRQLGSNLYRIMQLFKKWDVDCDGEISIDELGLAMNALAIQYDQDSLQALFQELDTDQSGSIDFDELNHALRKHLPRTLPPNKVCLDMPKRREPTSTSQASVRRAVHALTLALQARLDRVSTLFADWDTNGDGAISKREMQRALAALSIPIDRVAIDALFEQLDEDQSGGIDFHELNRLLRREFRLESDIVEARVIGQSRYRERTVSRDDERTDGSQTPPALDVTIPAQSMHRALHGQPLKRRTMKKTKSARAIFAQRMQGYAETQLRELMREKEEEAEAAKLPTILTRSRTEPDLKWKQS